MVLCRGVQWRETGKSVSAADRCVAADRRANPQPTPCGEEHSCIAQRRCRGLDVGHERVGTLPRTAKWQDILAGLGGLEGEGGATVPDIARRTLDNVRVRYQRIHGDPGVQAAFTYLLALATDCYNRPETRDTTGLDLDKNPSPLRIAAGLNSWVSTHTGSIEYAELARRAGGDTIVYWTREKSAQGTLFAPSTSARRVWQAAADASGFCEVARVFFARFTERYLRYFLEREASAEIKSLEAREEFSRQLSEHVDAISRHAYETSKITQSFAAGWFNNHARGNHPSPEKIEAFLALSFGKLQEELHREAR